MSEQDETLQPDTAQIRCGVCGTVLAGRRAFAAHRPTDPAATYPDPPADRPPHAVSWPEGMHQCVPPETLGMVHGPGGAWLLPSPKDKPSAQQIAAEQPSDATGRVSGATLAAQATPADHVPSTPEG